MMFWFWIKMIIWLGVFISGGVFFYGLLEIDESCKRKQEMIIGLIGLLLFFSVLYLFEIKKYEGFEYEAKLYYDDSIVKAKGCESWNNEKFCEIRRADYSPVIVTGDKIIKIRVEDYKKK